MRRSILIVGLLLVATACQPGASASGGPDSSGGATREVSGAVSAGPTCPVVHDPPDPSCADRPVAGALLVVEDPDGREVARTTSGADGSFQLELLPGSYQLVAQPVEGLLGTPGPMELTVPANGEVLPVTVSYDTGIR